MPQVYSQGLILEIRQQIILPDAWQGGYNSRFVVCTEETLLKGVPEIKHQSFDHSQTASEKLNATIV